MAVYEGEFIENFRASNKGIVAQKAALTLEQRLAQTEKTLRELQAKEVSDPNRKPYLINPNIHIENLGTHIVVHGDINLSGLNLSALPDLSLVIVQGDFDCSNNNLINLIGAPKKIRGDFNCSHNSLISLKGAPQEVGLSFNCSHNKLSDLEFAPQDVGSFVGFYSRFDCSHNNLTTLAGAPKKMRGDFDCSDNQLTSLRHAPYKIGGDFRGYNNPFDKYALLAFSRSHLHGRVIYYKGFEKKEAETYAQGSFIVSIAGSGLILERKDLQNPLRLAYQSDGIRGVIKVLTFNSQNPGSQTPALPAPQQPTVPEASHTILIPAPELSPREHFQAAMDGLDKLDPTQRAEVVKDILLLAAEDFNASASQAVIEANHAKQTAEQILAQEKAKLEQVIDAAQTSQQFLKSMFPNVTDAFWEELRKATADDLGGKTPLLSDMMAKSQPPGP